MTKESYIKMTQPFRDNPGMAQGLHILNRVCTLCMYLAYPGLIVYMLWQRDATVARMIQVPLDGFLIVSVGRYFLNRPRPYEAFGVAPVIRKDTRGKSFPSRHVFSSMIIALTFLMASPFRLAGMIFLVITGILAAVRVLSGVHYISDVLAGMAFALLVAVIGYVVI